MIVIDDILAKHSKNYKYALEHEKERFCDLKPGEVKEAIKEIIEEVLKTAYESGLIDRKPTGEGESSEEYACHFFEGDLGYEDYIPVEYTINKSSILNTIYQVNFKL